MDAKDILKSTPFFSEVLDDREEALLADKARMVAFKAGDTLMTEDDPGSSMFVIATGEAVVTIGGQSEPVAKLGPGGIVGEMSLLTGEPRAATVTASGAVEALEVDKDALANVLWMSSTLVDRFVEMLFRRQLELERAQGGAAWGMMGEGKAELAGKIHLFFENALSGEVPAGDAADVTEHNAAVAAVDAAIVEPAKPEPPKT